MGNDLQRHNKITPHHQSSLHLIKLKEIKQPKSKEPKPHYLKYLDEYGNIQDTNPKFFNFASISAIDTISYSSLIHLSKSNQMTQSHLIHLIVNGIPFDHREILWKQLVHFEQIKQKHSNPNNYYLQLLAQHKLQKCNGFATILADIPRTFAHHQFFRINSTKTKLRNILIAFSVHCPSIGYVQGLNYLVALLLFHFHSETDAFWMLCALMSKFQLSSYYEDGMEQLQRSSALLGESIDAKHPRLSDKLQNAGVYHIAYTTPYFLTLLSYNVTLSVCAQFWDFMLFADVLFDDAVNAQMLIKEFILLHVEIKEREWKGLDAMDLMKRLKVIDVDEYEMSVMLQQIINMHRLKSEGDVMQRLDDLGINDLDFSNENVVRSDAVVEIEREPVIKSICWARTEEKRESNSLSSDVDAIETNQLCMQYAEEDDFVFNCCFIANC